MKKYTEIMCLAGPVLKISIIENVSHSAVSDISNSAINDLLTEGYEIIEIITHSSLKRDMLATMFVMGRLATNLELD